MIKFGSEIDWKPLNSKIFKIFVMKFFSNRDFSVISKPNSFIFIPKDSPWNLPSFGIKVVKIGHRNNLFENFENKNFSNRDFSAIFKPNSINFIPKDIIALEIFATPAIKVASAANALHRNFSLERTFQNLKKKTHILIFLVALRAAIRGRSIVIAVGTRSVLC